jgi:hypothetical protein
MTVDGPIRRLTSTLVWSEEFSFLRTDSAVHYSSSKMRLPNSLVLTSAAAEEAGLSRIYAGHHSRSDHVAGRDLGVTLEVWFQEPIAPPTTASPLTWRKSEGSCLREYTAGCPVQASLFGRGFAQCHLTNRICSQHGGQ